MTEDKPTTVPFHYIKSNFFRVVHTDGVLGSITPAGLIFFTIYSERTAIPQTMVHEITEAGQVGAEHAEERIGKKGIVREMEVGAVMNVDTATQVVKWLQQQIELVQKIRNTDEAAKAGTHGDAVH